MFDPHAGAAYSFERMTLAAAEERAQGAEVPHIVETINWTKSGGDDVRCNRYFARGLDEALGLAVRLRFGFEESVEEIVAVRPATAAEAAGGLAAYTYFHEAMPSAISGEDVERQRRSREGDDN
jgi:hypothetical protein